MDNQSYYPFDLMLSDQTLPHAMDFGYQDVACSKLK